MAFVWVGEVGSGPPNRLFLRGNAQIPLNITQNGSVRGESPPQAENFAVFRVLKCRFLRGNRSESGPKMVQIWSKLPDPGNPPSVSPDFGPKGGGVLKRDGTDG